jgi:serine/threonine protein kinase
MPTQPDQPEPSAPQEDSTLILPRREMGSGLPVGHRLEEFEVEAVIGEGGFSIVYRARDTRLDRRVALKEYIPSSLAYRGRDGEVAPRSERHRETYQLGLRSFINEARLLASFDHPSLVKVYRFWEENGTAYMVMPYYQGPTLRYWLSSLGTPPSERWLRAMVAPLVDVLEMIHGDHCYHRDVAPDNILLLVDRAAGPFLEQTPRPLLLDFGAARRVIGDATQSLTVILKTGYAPVEQYAHTATMRQGPWTDVYALCAVLYHAVTGRTPDPSVGRLINDELESAADAGAGQYSPQFLAAIDAGLAVRPDARPQSMTELRRLLEVPATVPVPVTRSTQVDAASSLAPHEMPTIVAAPATLLQFGTVFDGEPEQPAQAQRAPQAQTSDEPAALPREAPAATVSKGSRHAKPIALAAIGGLVLAATAWWWVSRDAPVTTPAGAPNEPATPKAVEAAPATAPVAAPAFNVVSALQDMVKRGDPALTVNATAEKSTLTIGRDRLQLRVRSSEAGYLYLFLAGTDKNHFYLLFPNQRDPNNRIAVNQEIAVPRQGFSFEAAGPPGTNHIVAMVSPRERDLSGTGLRRIVSGEIPEFDLAFANQRWTENAGTMNPFVGKAICPQASRCDERYGATLIEIEEVNPPPAR